MKSVVIGCARDEHNRLRNIVLQKRPTQWTDQDKPMARAWNTGPRGEWIMKRKDLLHSVSEDGKE